MRRLAALFGIVLILALALTLLWRVWVHHHNMVPLDEDETSVVALDARATTFVKIANVFS